MGLIAHVDTKRVSEAEVMAVPPVPYTPTWHPIHHKQVIKALDAAIHNYGLEVTKRDYSLSKDGGKMFGTWAIQGFQGLANKRLGVEMGIRNSMNKSLSLGICAGTRVFVCDNLAFSGEFVAFRKHTGRLDMDQLIQISIGAVSQLGGRFTRMINWQMSLESVRISEQERKILAYDLVVDGVFPPSKFEDFRASYDEEFNSHELRSESLFTVHGACTRMMRGWNLMKVSQSAGRLEDVLNQFMLKYR